MVGKITHLQVIPHQSTQNAANLPLQTYEKNQRTFLLYDMGIGLNSRNNFANLGLLWSLLSPLYLHFIFKTNSLLEQIW